MFTELIRRKFGGEPVGSSDAAFESTTVSLSTAVPRPAERRSDERLSAMLRVGKLTDAAGNEQLIKVKNLSAGGVMAIVTKAPEVGEQVSVELSSQRIPSSVVWIRDESVGLKFDQNVDLGELLAGRKPRHGFRPRPPRLDIPCKASVRVGKKVVVVVESLRPVKGEVRWYSDRRAGIVFERPLEFEELAEWVGKRLELASLKASYKAQ